MNTDIAFIHAPSIYDFRKRNLKEGPIGDVVPSTPLFEMYPVGFISMLNYAISQGFNGRISNLAVLMLSDDRFDAERYIKLTFRTFQHPIFLFSLQRPER